MEGSMISMQQQPMMMMSGMEFQSQNNLLGINSLNCRQHNKKIDRMCLAFDCRNPTRLICSDCYQDANRHGTHREKIVLIEKMATQSKQVMEELKYRGVEKKELQKLNIAQFDTIVEEIWNMMQNGLREILERGRDAIKRLNEHIESANNNDMDDVFGNMCILESMDKSNKNEIEKVLESLYQYSQSRNDNVLDLNVNSYLTDMYRKQKLSREIIIPDLQKDIRERLMAYAKEMLYTCDKFIQNNIIENNTEIIRNEGISVQAPFKNEIIKDCNDLQQLINKDDQTINSLFIQRRVSIYENVEDAFHIIPPYITKINYQLDTNSRNFFQKIKYMPPTVKMIEISGTDPDFESFKLPKSIQSLKLTLKQMKDIKKVIDGFIRYTPQKLQNLELCFENCLISKKQINHIIQSFKYLPNTLKSYELSLTDNFLTPYSINKLILYSRYLPKSVHKVTINVANQYSNANQIQQGGLQNNEYYAYDVLNLIDSFPKKDILKKLDEEKVSRANLYYGQDQNQLEYSFVRELLIDLSKNLFDEQYNFFCKYLFKVFTNLSKFTLKLNGCGLTNNTLQEVAKLILEIPVSIKTMELQINSNQIDQFGIQCLLEAIQLKKEQLSNFIIQLSNTMITQEHINIIKEFAQQNKIHLEIIS